ncbi:MAG: hypothetical protein HC900_00560 [Methylacidiphilales bacterium]|nr:hypothetical protein [Candidatus Methylacidiphilales bacterium]
MLTKPPKVKFALCVCITHGYFVWINTKVAPHGKDQLALAPGCHPLVTHDSFLDLSRVVVHSTAELEGAKEFPCISRDLRDLIVAAIDAGLIVLPLRHATIIKTNLIVLYPDP